MFELSGDASNTGSPANFVDVTRTPYSDLIVDEVIAGGEASSGQPLEVSWTISNRGIATTDRDTWTDYVYISDDPTGATNLRLIGSSVHGGALSVDGSYTRTAEVAIPRDADGEHYLFVRTGGPYEFIYGGFESGNQGRSDVVDVTFIPPPPTNLRVTEVSLGGLTEADDGTQVEVTWTVRNDGPEDPENGFEDRLYLQATGTSERYEFGRYRTDDPLPAGMTITRTELVTLPRTTGQFRFFVDTDTRNSVIETDEGDNTTFSDPLQINLKARPDLRVTEINAPEVITAGTIIDVDFTVSNLGTADTPSAGSRWSDRVYLSSSSSSTSGAILLGELQNGSALGFPGTTSGQPSDYRSTASFLVPRALSGNWFVLVVADARGNVDEFPAEGNNMAASAIAIDANPVPPPDLVADFINGPGDAFDDSSFTVRYKVSNRGAGVTDPGSWTDQIWLTLGLDGPNAARGDIFIGTNRHSGVLDVGESYEAEATVRIPTGVTGQYFLTVYADGYGGVYEAAFADNVNPDAPNDLEGSNYASTPINILLTPPADLQVTRVEVDGGGRRHPDAADPSLPFQVTWQVSNNGTAVTDRESWADAIYVSEDAEFSSDDQLVFALPHSGAIQPGESYEHTAEFTLPPSAAGSHILVRTNVDPRIALTEEEKFLQEVRAVLERIEAATGQPIGETSISDLQQFSRSELLAILAGPANTLVQVYEGPFAENNVGASEATVIDAEADFVVTSVIADESSRSGEDLNVRWTVENQGDFATDEATRSVRQLVYLSKDEVFDVSRAILVSTASYALSQPLQPGESYTDSATVATPPGSSGTWYAHVFTNVAASRGRPVLQEWNQDGFPEWFSYFADRVWEDGTRDNNFAVSNEIAIEYAEANLVISGLSVVPTDPDSGSFFDVSYTVTNEGTRDTRVDAWNDGVFLSTDSSLDSFDFFLGGHSRREVLAIGESYDVTTQVRLPFNIDGPFNVIVAADTVFRDSSGSSLPYPSTNGRRRLASATDKVLEFADEGDNLQQVPLDVQFVATPDLVIDSVTTQSRVVVGEDFSISYTVSNDGGAIPDTQVPYIDRVYLSRDRFLDPSSDHYVTRFERGQPLPVSGGTESYAADLRLPRGLTGDYYVIIQTDVPRAIRPDGEVIESNEENNIRVSDAPMLIETPPPTDLQVVNVSAPSSVSVGDVVTVNWTVENRGDEPARARIADAVYLSEDAVWDLGDSFVGRRDPISIFTVNPGESYTGTLQFEVPAQLPGDYRVIVRTDIFDDVVEGENNRNNAGFSADTMAVTVPLLRLDVPLDDQLAQGVSRLYQLDVDPGETIRIDLDSLDDVGSQELFVAHERLPKPFDFDAAYEGYLRPDQSLVIPETVGGRYFVLARAGVRVSVDDQETDLSLRREYPIQLNATRVPFGITDVTPDSGGDDRYVTVQIRGAEFPEQAAVRLVRPELAEFAPVSISRVDATELIAVFDLRDAHHGLYDVQVLHPDGRIAVEPYRFQIESADSLQSNIGVGGPSQIDLGATGAYGFPIQSLSNVDTPYTIFEYAFPNVENRFESIVPGPAIEFASGLRGDVGTVAPLFDSVSTFDFGSVVPELNLNGALTARGVAIDLPADGVTEVGAAVTIYPGLREILEMDPNFLRELDPFILDDMAFDFYVVAAATPLSTPQYVEYQTAEANRLRDAILADDDAPAGLRSIAGDRSAFVALYLQALTDIGLLRPEDAPPVPDGRAANTNAFFTAVGGLLGGDAGSGIVADAETNLATAEQTLGDLIEKLRAYYGHTEGVFGGGTAADREDYDLGLANPTSFATFTLRAGPPPLFESGVIVEDIVFDTEGLGQFASENITIEGPTGFGEDNFVPISTPLPYSITVTYDDSQSEAAREIRIIVPLDDTLDERTVQVADIELGGREISLPPGRPNFVGEIDLFEDEGYVLQVTAGIDASTRVVSYLLRAIDPRDGLPPVDPAIGLLQPGESVEVGFWVNADTLAAAGTGGDLQTGDLIEMTARVIVDGEEAVDSQSVVATLDAVPPQSNVTAVPLGGDRYELSWSSIDDPGGSGVAAYSLLVSNDGGNRYRSVLYRTGETSHIYEARPGQTPQFLVRGIDAAGNLEPVPDGIRVPRLVPEINLGSAPRVSVLPTFDLPRAEAADDVVVGRLFTEAAFGVPSRTSATKPSQFARVIRPLAAERFATIPGDSGAGIGALAMAVAPEGDRVYVSGGAGRNQLYVVQAAGSSSNALERLTAFPATSPIYDLAFDSAGQLWASTGGEGLLQLDPNTGAVLDSIGAGISLGIASIPGENALYVATTGGIQRFDTATRQFTSFSDVRVDSVAVSADGVLYGNRLADAGRSAAI